MSQSANIAPGISERVSENVTLNVSPTHPILSIFLKNIPLKLKDCIRSWTRKLLSKKWRHVPQSPFPMFVLVTSVLVNIHRLLRKYGNSAQNRHIHFQIIGTMTWLMVECCMFRLPYLIFSSWFGRTLPKSVRLFGRRNAQTAPWFGVPFARTGEWRSATNH